MIYDLRFMIWGGGGQKLHARNGKTTPTEINFVTAEINFITAEIFGASKGVMIYDL